MIGRGTWLSREPNAAFILDRMTIRRFQRQRCIAWMAVVAILLLSIVPTVSQIASLHGPHAGHTHQSMPAGHAGQTAQAPKNQALKNADHDDECWRKCGYCDFLAHSPALVALAYLPSLSPAPAPIPIDRERARPRYATPILAAQPRGPPSLLA